MAQISFNVSAEMLEVYKIHILEKIKQGYEYAEVPCELLVALIEGTQALVRQEVDKKRLAAEKEQHGTSNVG